MRSKADHTYGYAEALADGVVRPVVFMAYSGEARWRDSAGEEHAARLGEPLTAEHTARAWRTALDPAGEWMPAVIAAADTRLRQLRQHVPDAGGMIIASDQTAARAYAELLTTITGERPTLVLSDDPGSSERISQFTSDTTHWLVAVRMVSEGVDVPRLAVGVYATSASTPLFFAQAIGRFVRSRRPGETASIFLPSVPNLLLLASELEAQRNHVLGKPHRESTDEDPLDRELAEQRKDEPGELDNGFTSLGADAELDQVIFDGSSFGTATPAGSDEEADYLGIPGLLDAAQMRDLLRRRQDEQLQKRTETGEPAVRGTTHGQLRELRRELNALVTIAHHRTGKPHGWIHNELRRICGGPPIAAATTDQLKARIEAVRSLQA
jgi:superfamily II DNA or RNA helicase